MSRAMFRYVVPVDDERHAFSLTGDPVAFASAGNDKVEFWAEHDDSHNGMPSRAFQIFGTGQPLPDSVHWIGTCPRTPDGLVWHLYEYR
jgi:hypothetical protein